MTSNSYARQPIAGLKFTPIGSGAHLLAVACNVALLVLLYAQTAGFDYVYFDDDRYVLLNPDVLAGLSVDSARWAFTSLYMSNWHPLTWLSHMLDVSLFGTDPGPAHLHNVVLHGLNSLLVYALLLRYGAGWWRATLLSLVFMAHPLHVESVAWIAERKDLLCALFFLLGLLAYDRYRRAPSALPYLGTLGCCALALMAKAMAVTFPLVLVLLDSTLYAQRLRAKPGVGAALAALRGPLLMEKLPLLGMSLAVGVVTIAAQDQTRSVAYLEAMGFAGRVHTALNAYLTYLLQWLRPIDLAPLYPLGENFDALRTLLATGVLLSLAVVAVVALRRNPTVSAGIGWYLVTLLPVIGLLQVGSQAHADRYMYLPSIGVLLACLPLIPLRGDRRFGLGAGLGCSFLLYLCLLSYWQIGYWVDEHTLFTRSSEVTGPNLFTHVHLAQAYERYRMPTLAETHGRAAIEIAPAVPDGYRIVAGAALAQSRFGEAERLYRQVLAMGAESASVLNNLGIAVAEQGRAEQALPLFERALEIDPRREDARSNLRHYGEKTR